MFSWLSGLEMTDRTVVPEVTGLIPWSDEDFLVC